MGRFKAGGVGKAHLDAQVVLVRTGEIAPDNSSKITLGLTLKEIPMRKLSQTALFAAAATALALPAAPALAMQDPGAAPQAMTPEHKAEKKQWPEDTKAFYSSLSPDQQQVFMTLSDEDKVTLSRMEPTQRDDMMRQLQERMQGSAEGR